MEPAAVLQIVAAVVGGMCIPIGILWRDKVKRDAAHDLALAACHAAQLAQALASAASEKATAIECIRAMGGHEDMVRALSRLTAEQKRSGERVSAALRIVGAKLDGIDSGEQEVSDG